MCFQKVLLFIFVSHRHCVSQHPMQTVGFMVLNQAKVVASHSVGCLLIDG